MGLERRLALAFDAELGVKYPNNPVGALTDLMNDETLALLARAAIATIDVQGIRALLGDLLVIMKPDTRIVDEWERRVLKVLRNTE